jgi:hypothetical protein
LAIQVMLDIQLLVFLEHCCKSTRQAYVSIMEQTRFANLWWLVILVDTAEIVTDKASISNSACTKM